MQRAPAPPGVEGELLSSVLNKLSIFSDYSQHNMPKGIGSIYYFLKKINELKHSLQTYNIYFNVLSINITRLAFYQVSWKNHLRELLFVKLDYRKQSIKENSLVTIGKKYRTQRNHPREEIDAAASSYSLFPPKGRKCGCSIELQSVKPEQSTHGETGNQGVEGIIQSQTGNGAKYPSPHLQSQH